ncbi:hypothetical protein [Burkholderia cenocepacia]|uniref:hypothetical protein n=1 Tax=Burkholderia cenocepacia TaxID=95486 RepID=UPI0028762A79|nr:hypothetical protein [Burkholderia cenocepacia]MDS0850506.1 hypothetical protein [Burkholderia cenocepacia]
MDTIKANPDDVNFLVFDARKLRKAVKAVQEQPKLAGRELLKLKHERDTLTACFDEVVSMMRTLEDKTLADFNKAGADRLEALRGQIEPLHATWQKWVAARDAREYLHLVLEECLKLADLVTYSRAIEKGQTPAT